MEVSADENDDEIALPCIPVKPQKTLFSYFNVDKRSATASVQRVVTNKTLESKPNKTCNEVDKKKKCNKGNINRNSGISISLFGQNAVKRIGKPTHKSDGKLHKYLTSGTESDDEVDDENDKVMDNENNNLSESRDNEEGVFEKGSDNQSSNISGNGEVEGSIEQDDNNKENNLLSDSNVEVENQNALENNLDKECDIDGGNLKTIQNEITNEELKPKDLCKTEQTSVIGAHSHKTSGIHVETSSDKTSEMHGGTSSDSASEMHGYTSSDKTSEIHGETSSGETNEVYVCTSSDVTSGVHVETSSDKTSEIHGCTSSDKTSEMHVETSSDKTSEIHGCTSSDKTSGIHVETSSDETNEMHGDTSSYKTSEMHNCTSEMDKTLNRRTKRKKKTKQQFDSCDEDLEDTNHCTNKDNSVTDLNCLGTGVMSPIKYNDPSPKRTRKRNKSQQYSEARDEEVDISHDGNDNDVTCSDNRNNKLGNTLNNLDKIDGSPQTNLSPIKKIKRKKKRLKLQFDSSDEESCEIDKKISVCENDADDKEVSCSLAEHVPKVVPNEFLHLKSISKESSYSALSKTIDEDVDGQVTNLLKEEEETNNSNYLDKEGETSTANVHDKVDDKLHVVLSESNYEIDADRKDTFPHFKLINSIYPSTQNSKYKSLLCLTDKKSEMVDSVPTRSVDDCLALLQNIYPDIAVRKVFQQLLSCQKNTITKNLTKLESTKKQLETIWQRDTKMKNEEMAVAEELRLKKEEIARAELKKKKRNDIRSSFKHGKTKKKKMDVNIQNNSSEEKENIDKLKDNKKSTKEGQKKSKKKKGIAGKVISSGSEGKENIDHPKTDKNDTKSTGVGKKKRKGKNSGGNKIDSHSTEGEKDDVENDIEPIQKGKQSKKKRVQVIASDTTEEEERSMENVKNTGKKRKSNKKNEKKMKQTSKRKSGIEIYLQSSNVVHVDSVKNEILPEKKSDLPKDVNEEEAVKLFTVCLTKGEIEVSSETVSMSDCQSTEERSHEQGVKSKKRKLHRSNSNSKKKFKLSAEEPTTRRRSLRNQAKISTDIYPSKPEVLANSDADKEDKFTAVIDDKTSKESSSDNNVVDSSLVDKNAETLGDMSISAETENTTNLRRSTRVRKTVIQDLPKELEAEENEDVVLKEMSECDDDELDEVTIVETVERPEAVVDKEASKKTLNKIIEKLDLLESPRKSPKKPRPEIKLDEEYINSCLSWTEKYQPEKARYIIGDVSNSRQVYDWLYSWKERQESALRKISRSSKQQASESESDSESELSDFEDYLSNTIMLSGPCGCGTTATVYACANQLDYKVLELNPSIYRTGKQIFDKVSEAVVSHQVNKVIDVNDVGKQPSDPTPNVKNSDFFTARKEKTESKKDPTPNIKKSDFFTARKEKTESKKEKTESKKEKTESKKEKTESEKEQTESEKEQTESKKEKTESRKEKTETMKEKTGTRKEEKENKKDVIEIIKSPIESTCPTTSVDAMSLVLFEQVDIVYEDIDRGFYQGIIDLCMLAKRPIILTANDPKVLEFIFSEEDSWIDHISLTYPSTEKLLPMLQLTCLVEQVFVPEQLLREVISWCKNDIRKIILQLMFWCDQGKQPLYKHWKAKTKNAKKSLDEVHKVETNMTDEMEIVTDNERKRNTFVTEISNVSPIYKCESYVNKDLVLNEGKCTCSNIHRNYSFSKGPVKDAYSYMDHIAESADNISELNSRLHGGLNCSEMDHFKWTSTLGDSLSDSFVKENNNHSSLPMKSMFRNMKEIYKENYESYIQKEVGCVNNRINMSYTNMYKSVIQGDSAKYNINRRPFLEDILPYMKKVCQLEELKLSSLHHRKRGNRRYMHYLQASGIYLEEDILTQLSKSLL